MAMSARVSNIGGRIVGEKRNGSYRSHQHDALGNTIALINDSGVVTDTYTYWPYGELRTSTGTTTNPFKFCGAWGYYTDTTGRTYVRARTLRPGLTRWMTVDPLWPSEHQYSYALGNPSTWEDYSGLACSGTRCCCCPVSLSVKLKGIRIGNTPPNNQVYVKHLFDLEVAIYRYKVVNIPPAPASDCQLKWIEGSDQIYDINGGCNPGTLENPLDLMVNPQCCLSPTIRPWCNRDKSCESATFVLEDAPTFLSGTGTRSRLLCFRFVLIGSPNCECGAPIERTAEQRIKFVNGKVVEAVFVSPAVSQKCKGKGK
jgi:RHS repeat-associated protein